MRLLRLLCIAFAFGLELGLGAGARAEAEFSPHQTHQSEVALPPVSALPPRPAEPWTVPALLPPGARTLEQRSPRLDLDHDVFLEPLPDGSDDGSSREWIEYTVDARLEERVRSVLTSLGFDLAHVILLDPESGEVLAYVSSDPEHFPSTRAYPMASLMKVVTAAALLRKSPAAATQSCRYVGSPYQVLKQNLRPPRQGGQVVSFWRAMATSNNQCFARNAVRDLGEKPLIEEARALGLLEAPGALHAPGRVEEADGALGLGRLGSGLAGSFITPLAAARLAAVLARGELVQPYWVAQIRDARGHSVAVPERAAPRPVWPEALAEELRRHMVDVTESGTAHSAFRNGRGEPRLGEVRVAGKTGTLSGSEPEGLYQWFIGVAPADAPRIAIAAVSVDGPFPASQVAAVALEDVFCDPAPCRAANADPLLARARERDTRARAEIQARAPRVVDLTPEEVERVRGLTKLDHAPRPVGAARIDLPRRLRETPVDGRIVLFIDLSREGRVVGVQVDSSDLPEFDPYVIEQVKDWAFTPPTQGGVPVAARARLPIPIRIR